MFDDRWDLFVHVDVTILNPVVHEDAYISQGPDSAFERRKNVPPGDGDLPTGNTVASKRLITSTGWS